MAGKDLQTFERILRRWDWKPIRNCPGRFTLAGGVAALPAAEIAAAKLPFAEFAGGIVPDPVLVMPFADGGGLISYRKGPDLFLHTLNDAAGFARKLNQLKIEI